MKLALIGIVLLTLQGCVSFDTILKEHYDLGFSAGKSEDRDTIQYLKGQNAILNSIANDQAAKIQKLREQLKECK